MKRDQDKTKEQLIDQLAETRQRIGELEALETERRQAEEELEKSEQKYQSLVEDTSVGVVAVDITGRFTFVNKALCEMLGYSKEELIQKPFADFLHPDDTEATLQSFANAFADPKGKVDLECRVLHKEGRPIHMHASITHIKVDGGQTIGSNAMMTDVTERKQAEEALGESEEKYRDLTENISDTIYAVDEDGNVTYVSPVIESYLGYSPSEIIGRSFAEFLHHEDLPRAAESFQRTLSGQTTAEEYRFPTRSREMRWMFTSNRPIFDGDRVVGARGVLTDITERKQAEEALRESEERYRTVLEEMQDSYFEVDLRGHITFANESTCRNLRLSREELTGASYKTFSAEKSIDDVYKAFNKAYRTGKPVKDFSWEIVRGDGSTGFAETTVLLLHNQDRQIIGFRGIGRDITERKQAEEALRQSEEKYRGLFDQSMDAVYISTRDGRFADVNPATLNLFGYTREEMLALDVHKIYANPAARSRFQKEVERKGSVTDYEVQFRKKDDTPMDCLLTATVRLTADGSVLGYQGIIRDTTEHKQAEEALRQSEERYRTLFDSKLEGVIVIDETMKPSLANQAAADIFGFDSTEQLLEVNPFDMIPPEERERVLTIIAKDMFAEDLRQVNEFRLIKKTGEEIWISAVGALIEYEGKPAGLISFRDITKRKQAEEKIQQQNEFLSNVLESLTHPFYVIDANDYSIIMANTAAKPAGLPENLTCYALTHNRDKPCSGARHTCPLKEIKRTKKDAVMEHIHYDKAGNPRAVEIHGYPVLDTEGNVIQMIEYSLDITERKKMEEQLRGLSRHLQAAREQERTGMAREIHDELGQTLTALKMDVAWLRGRLPEGQEPLLEKTESMADLIDATTKTVRRMSTELRPGLLDDLGIVAAIEWQTEEFQDRTGIRCQVGFDPEDIAVDQDRSTAIFRILQETLTNVARHSKATRVKVSLKQKDTDLVLRVRDNGKGIAPDKISAAKSFGLMGIRERAQVWGGDVKISGVPDKGTTVIASIPLEERNADDTDTRR